MFVPPPVFLGGGRWRRGGGVSAQGRAVFEAAAPAVPGLVLLPLPPDGEREREPPLSLVIKPPFLSFHSHTGSSSSPPLFLLLFPTQPEAHTPLSRFPSPPLFSLYSAVPFGRSLGGVKGPTLQAHLRDFYAVGRAIFAFLHFWLQSWAVFSRRSFSAHALISCGQKEQEEDYVVTWHGGRGQLAMGLFRALTKEVPPE